MRVKEEVLIEAGHRCAVCCETSALEIAHIIPWHKSKQHKLDDLVCLCANCHTKADRERWSQRVFRRYKHNPCVLRIAAKLGETMLGKERVKITLKESFQEWNPTMQKMLESAVAAFLRIPRNHVRVVSVEEGSIQATLEVPAEKAESLRAACDANDALLFELIYGAELIPEVDLFETGSFWSRFFRFASLLPIGIGPVLGGILGAWIFSRLLTNPEPMAPGMPVPAPGVREAVANAFAENSWVMACFFISILGVVMGWGLSFAGLVRAKNVVSVMAQCMAVVCVVGVVWWVIGYSLVFSPGNPFIGTEWQSIFGAGIRSPAAVAAVGVSPHVFVLFQMAFAMLAPVLIVGVTSERMKFSAMLLFSCLWLLVVFCPVAHMLWGQDGLMNGIGNPAAKVRAVDFAGALVVHAVSGLSSLVLCLLLGRRSGFGKEPMPPHSMVLTMMGTCLIWVGSYGMHGGRAFDGNDLAMNSIVATTIAAMVGCLTWMCLEFVLNGKSSLLGLCSGVVSGIVVISGGCGNVTIGSAALIGLLGSAVTFVACVKLKSLLRYDDTVDVVMINGLGGCAGAIFTGVFANGAVNPDLNSILGVISGNTLWFEQLKAVVIVTIVATIGTMLITQIIKTVIGLRVTPEIEHMGLDLGEHGETGYDA